MIIEGDEVVGVYKGKLLKNCRTQYSPAHQEGYQPFLFNDYERKYDIKTATFETIRINSGKSYTGKYYVNRIVTKQKAVILKIPSQDSEQFRLLEMMRSRTSLEEQVRQSVSADSWDFTKLDIAAQLLQEAVLGDKPRIPLAAIAPADKRFEFYIQFAPDQVLTELCSLLEIKSQPEQAKAIPKSA